MAGLLLFMAAYFTLAFWFLYTVKRVFVDGAGADLGVFAYLLAVCSLFLGVFMIKAIFSVKNTRPEGLLEVTAGEQPVLFDYLFALADAAGAPRPHKVFLSARVNAAVFYDLSLLNLIFPSRKNLEIGLALVNTLSLGEFRAVLAHEFGHFAQRSMAVGRWVYVAQQIATHLVTRRDKLDELLVTIGRIDLRVYAVVAVVQLVIWSIRALVESLFRLVIVMQRALSREMEMQADLVAVSLTGSDALIHALHRMHGADDAWERAQLFVFGEHGEGRVTHDVFAVQTNILHRMGALMNDDAYAHVPPLPAQGAERHRIFKPELAQPPKMWQTHPLNHEREANAKRLYIAADIDPVSAWSLFAEPDNLRARVTAQLLARTNTAGEATSVALDDSLHLLGRQFEREQYDRRYCGVFFGRPLTRHVRQYGALRDPAYQPAAADFAALYPASLTQDLQLLRQLEKEFSQLGALISGAMKVSADALKLRGVELRRRQLPAARARVREEIDAVAARLHAHDLRCRSWHQETARQLGGGWQAYLDGLLALLHYAEHGAADLSDAHGVMHNTASVVTALRRVSSAGVQRAADDANKLREVLLQIHREARDVVLDERVAERVKATASWGELLGTPELSVLSPAIDVGAGMQILDRWVESTGGWLNALRSAALEQLLLTENMIARQATHAGPLEAAPAPSQVPPSYTTLLSGAERPRQTELGWWARFQRADGWVPGAARLLVAGAIVALVLTAGSFGTGHGTSVFGQDPALMVYNGLGLTVAVTVDGHRLEVPPASALPLALPAFGKHHVEARSRDGRLIEAFDAEAEPHGHPVYNVAGAAPLYQWHAVYGKVAPLPETRLGAPRWLDSGADHLFSEPPKSISGSKYSEGSYRSVLAGAATETPEAQLGMFNEAKERERIGILHARWDDTSHPATLTWLTYVGSLPGQQALIAQRVKDAPSDVMLRRAEQDIATPADGKLLCRQAGERAAAKPDDSDLAYLALRCLDESARTRNEFRKAHLRWPNNPWLAYAFAQDKLKSEDWTSALPELEQVRASYPPLAPWVSADIGRIRHYLEPGASLEALFTEAPGLRVLAMLDRGAGEADSPERAYATLADGALDRALELAKANDWQHANVLRLVAASDGASAESIRLALALPADIGIDPSTAWLGLALALKMGQDPAPYRAQIEKVEDRAHGKMADFITSIHAGKDPRAAERLLAELHPEARARAYSAALVLLGKKAPAQWRQTVRRVLFASERPYFVQA